LTYESLSPTINLAYIKNNCWNLDDLTVNFRGTRKVRARPANVPSSSTPPAPSTSATPTPVPPGPSTHSSQHLEFISGTDFDDADPAGCGFAKTHYVSGAVFREGILARNLAFSCEGRWRSQCSGTSPGTGCIFRGHHP